MKALIESIKGFDAQEEVDADLYEQTFLQFEAATNPDAVLELIADIERHKENVHRAGLKFLEVCTQRDQLKAINTDLHATLQAAKGEIERLRLDNQSKDGSLKALGKNLKDRERQLRKLGGVVEENKALRELTTELYRSVECSNVHHCKAEQHGDDEPCKVLARIEATMSKGEQS
ncbi:hypothetical protein [Pseudomonas sp. NFACC02]|uniref:hypothetical protein n=1 Tax=Pseudomonas sp. NFACC02 TaxID=1566250 RepID=UPI001114281A|nr:hypothetical protein [Pseudomonas sp. NFACC02]